MRDASIGVLSRVPARALPAVPMATRTDLTLTAIDRDRIAYVSFATTLSQADGGKAAEQVAKSQPGEDAHEAASGVRDDAV
jgi:hypothetical protein